MKKQVCQVVLSTSRKMKQSAWGLGRMLFYIVVREGLSQKRSFEHRPEGDERVNKQQQQIERT